MKNRLYHSSLPNFPVLNIADKMVKLNPTCHAIEAAYNDRYGIIDIPEKINLSKVKIFEIEVDDIGNLIKVCIRMKYNDDYDLCMPILIKGLKIKTVWLNSVNDRHNTLDRSKYANG